MIFNKKYTKDQVNRLIEEAVRDVIKYNHYNLTQFTQSIDEKLNGINNDLHIVARAETNYSRKKTPELLEDLETLKTDFAKEAVNKLYQKARLELKNEALDILLKNHSYNINQNKI